MCTWRHTTLCYNCHAVCDSDWQLHSLNRHTQLARRLLLYWRLTLTLAICYIYTHTSLVIILILTCQRSTTSCHCHAALHLNYIVTHCNTATACQLELSRCATTPLRRRVTVITSTTPHHVIALALCWNFSDSKHCWNDIQCITALNNQV